MRGLKWLALFYFVLVIDAAFCSQKVVFTGNLSIDNVASNADSAWLYISWYDNFIDSLLVTAETQGWGGQYRYEHVTTSDSVAGWTGMWVFVETSNSIRVNDVAYVSLAPDSIVADTNQAWALVADVSALALEASVTKIRDTAQYLVTATGFSTLAQVDSLKDTTEAASARVGDVEKISGDATAADNFETMLDGTGGRTLSVGRLENGS